MREALPEVVEEPCAQRVLDQMYRLWIEPAIQTRGLNLTRDGVMKAVVVMPPNGPIEVLLNDDVQLLAEAVAQRPIERGEGLTAADLVDIRHIEPAGVDPTLPGSRTSTLAVSSLWSSTSAATDRRRAPCWTGLTSSWPPRATR